MEQKKEREDGEVDKEGAWAILEREAEMEGGGVSFPDRADFEDKKNEAAKHAC